MEPLADAGGFLLLRANLTQSLEGGISCRDGLHAATRWMKTEPCALLFTESFAAIHAAGYDYQGEAVIPRPGKEGDTMITWSVNIKNLK